MSRSRRAPWYTAATRFATLKKDDGAIIVLRAGLAGKIVTLDISPYQIIEKDRIIGSLRPSAIVIDTPEVDGDRASPLFLNWQ